MASIRSNLDSKQRAALAQVWLRLNTLFSKNDELTLTSSRVADLSAGQESEEIQSGSNLVNVSTIPSADPTYAPHKQDVTIGQFRREWTLSVQNNHPDAFVLRFLRARKFDTTRAMTMLINTLIWRYQNCNEHLLEHGEGILPGSFFEGTKLLLSGEDKQGRPVVYVNAAQHFTSSLDLKTKEMCVLWSIENFRASMRDNIDTFAIVFNIQNLGVKNCDLELVKFMIMTLQNYFPESLGVCLIANAPWLFSGFWKVIRPMLDPVVAEKVHFVKSTDLEDFIDQQSVPDCVPGGVKPFTYRYQPPTKADIAAHQAKLEDKNTRAQLLQARLDALDQYTTLAVKWSEAVLNGDSDEQLEEIDAEKESLVVKKVSPTWFKYQEATRFPSFYHRAGAMSMSCNGVDWDKATC